MSELAVLVIHGLLPKRLAEALRDAAVHLSIDDQRVDDLAAIVHAHVAADLNVAGLAIDVGDHDVGAEGEREVRRLPEVRGTSPGSVLGGSFLA